MVARVTHVKVKPEDVEQAVRLFDDSVVPAAEQEEGFMGALLLTRADGRALVVDLCDSVEPMRANERSGFYQTQVAKFAGKLVDRPAREFYDVAVAKGVRGGPQLPRSGECSSRASRPRCSRTRSPTWKAMARSC